MAVITISRQFGSQGTEIAHQACQVLGYRFFQKQLMDKIALGIGLAEQEVIDFSEERFHAQSLVERFFGPPLSMPSPGAAPGVPPASMSSSMAVPAVPPVYVLDESPTDPVNVTDVSVWTEDTVGSWSKVVRKIGAEESAFVTKNIILAARKMDQMVIVGRGGQAILKDAPGVLHVRIIAPLASRIQHVQTAAKLSEKDAKTLVETRDRDAAEYLKRFYHIDGADPTLYHLILNAGKWGVTAAVSMVVEAVNNLSKTSALN